MLLSLLCAGLGGTGLDPYGGHTHRRPEGQTVECLQSDPAGRGTPCAPELALESGSRCRAYRDTLCPAAMWEDQAVGLVCVDFWVEERVCQKQTLNSCWKAQVRLPLPSESPPGLPTSDTGLRLLLRGSLTTGPHPSSLQDGCRPRAHPQGCHSGRAPHPAEALSPVRCSWGLL